MGVATDSQGCKTVFRVKEVGKYAKSEQNSHKGRRKRTGGKFYGRNRKTAGNGKYERHRGKIYLYRTDNNTGLVENTIFTGNRETVEKYLEPTIKKLPQVRLLIVTTESLAVCKPKVKTAGTLLNKYYNDVLSLMRKPKED